MPEAAASFSRYTIAPPVPPPSDERTVPLTLKTCGAGALAGFSHPAGRRSSAAPIKAKNIVIRYLRIKSAIMFHSIRVGIQILN
jgi:hypothetical protein